MCGIFFSLSRRDPVSPDASTSQLLRSRGPDSLGTHQAQISPSLLGQNTSEAPLHATFVATVLSLRGVNVTKQPLQDEESGCILCWNGEAWSIDDQPVMGNDSLAVFSTLLKSCVSDVRDSRAASIGRVVGTLASIRGPFAFVFYDARNHYLYYGRDCLGRRSLLQKNAAPDEIVLSSVCDNATGENWAEVEADGIYVIDLNEALDHTPIPISHIPHRRLGDGSSEKLYFDVAFPPLNPATNFSTLGSRCDTANMLGAYLENSVRLRVQHVREAADIVDYHDSNTGARIAVLFSGGLDCTILARLAHKILPTAQGIDLLNVAFENPRIHGNLAPTESPYELCPDRITGRSTHAELVRNCPDRHWRFVEIDIPYTETLKHRRKVMTLMHPHNTEMDLSISYALYFASRGAGLIRSSAGTRTPYVTHAHVLLSGLGADELFGGYQRHALAFSRQGYAGLVGELRLDFDRLGKRNLGRDDRVISDTGREVRFPYLDEHFITFALQLPVCEKCDFANPQLETSQDPARFLEPGKRILRLLAWELGMKGVAAEKKRAIQFGARTAKMETGKTKGTQVLT